MIIDGVHMNERSRPIDGFDLEQSIMEAWHVADDLKLLLNKLEYMNEDQIFSAVHGLEIFADMRMNNLWDTYEKYLSNRRFDDDISRGEEIAQALDEAFKSFGQEKL